MTKFWMRFVHSQDIGATPASACDKATGLITFAGDAYQLPDRRPPLPLAAETYDEALKHADLAWDSYEYRGRGLMGYVIVDDRNGALPTYWMRIIFGPELEASGWRDGEPEDWAFGLPARQNAKGELEHVGDFYNLADRVAPIALMASDINDAERDADRLWLMHPYGDEALGYAIVDALSSVEHVHWNEMPE